MIETRKEGEASERAGKGGEKENTALGAQQHPSGALRKRDRVEREGMDLGE